MSDHRDAIITAVLVSAAFGVFVLFVREMPNPRRTFATIVAMGPRGVVDR